MDYRFTPISPCPQMPPRAARQLRVPTALAVVCGLGLFLPQPRSFASPKSRPNTTDANLQILVNGQPATSTLELLVGVRVQVEGRARDPHSDIGDRQWALVGVAKSDYNPDRDSAHAIDWSEHPDDASSINFFWVSGGLQKVTFRAMINGRPSSRTVSFRVARPSATIMTRTHRVRKLGSETPILFLGGGRFPGIEFFGRTQPLSGGQTCWVQVLTHCYKHGKVHGNFFGLGGLWWKYPYDKGGDNYFGTETPTGSWQYPKSRTTNPDYPDYARDTPNQGAGVKLEWPVGHSSTNVYSLDPVIVKQWFSMWIMFRPPGPSDQTAWVPLSKVDWHWGGKLSGSNYDLSDQEVTKDPPGGDTLLYPEWDVSAVDPVDWVLDPHQGE